MTDEYRNRFRSKEAAAEYTEVYADPRSYANLLYGIEKSFLTRCTKGLGVDTRYLDFAVGTGRIITHMENAFPQAEGVDISEEMIAIARTRVRSATLYCLDITNAPKQAHGYALITSFRFFLNAEAALRDSIMQALSDRLDADIGRMVVNNHGRPLSIKFFSWLRDSLVSNWLGRSPRQVFMRDSEFADLARRHGLRIESQFGYGLLGGRIGRLLGPALSSRIEHAVAGSTIALWFGTCRLYVLQHQVAEGAQRNDETLPQ